MRLLQSKFADSRVRRQRSFIARSCAKSNEYDLMKKARKWVLKVSKKGTFLRNLQSLLPQGLLRFHVAFMKNLRFSTPMLLRRYQCGVICGTLLMGFV